MVPPRAPPNPGGARQLRHAEVGELDGAVAVDQDVGGLDVEVQGPVLVGIGEGLRERVGDACGLVEGERMAVDLREELLEAHAVDVLHDEVGVAGVVGEVDHRDDVGVLQQAHGARLGQGVGHDVGPVAPRARRGGCA